MARPQSLLLLLILLGSPRGGEGKNVRGLFHLDAGDEKHGPEYEISKFSFALGEGKIKGTVRYNIRDMNWQTSPALYLFNDENWEAYHKAPACMDKVEAAHTVVQIGTSSDGTSVGGRSNINYGYHHLAKNTVTSVRQVGQQVEWRFEWKIDTKERTKGWFLIAADCALEQYNTKVASMTYDITLLNPGNNQLPADEHWLPTTYMVLMGLMCVHIGYCLTLISTSVELNRKVPLVVKLLAAAYALQILSVLLELVHLFIYSMNGRGVWVLDFFSEVSEGLSSLVISFVLICLACGWTLVEEEADSKKSMSVATMFRNPKSMLQSGNWFGNLSVLLILALVVYVMFLMFWNKLGDSDFKKFHDSDTEHGTRLLQIRMGLFVFFALSLAATVRQQMRKGGSPILKSFLLKLLVFGSCWFVSFPLWVLLANMSAHYNRHMIVVTGVLFMQSSCIAALCHQFLAGSSTYARLSTAWESGILPGAGGLFTGQKGAKD